MVEQKEYKVLIWGYLPGVLSHKSLLTSPVEVQLPENAIDDRSWKDVYGGGCGFAMVISAMDRNLNDNAFLQARIKELECDWTNIV
ncbi:hypothetical protein CQW23_29002 [Capsicum baccatum]|uniref:Uncharacterized protein n=1 Tax=Capsicum baccatum TaxID=33114 RepID=A0A2G2VI56_CAPBA|nr:hypothetical protein CQW23_29002 [Capsicum baccatum]